MRGVWRAAGHRICVFVEVNEERLGAKRHEYGTGTQVYRFESSVSCLLNSIGRLRFDRAPNVALPKGKPCAGGKRRVSLITGNYRAVAFPSSVGSRSDQLDNTAAEF